MKVGFYTSLVDGPDSGPGIYRENLARALARRLSEDEISFIHYEPYDSDIYDTAEEIIVPQPPILPKVASWWTGETRILQNNYNIRTERYLRDNYGFDILHLQMNPFRRLFWLWDTDAKLVTTLHGFDFSQHGPLKEAKIRKTFRLFTRAFDAIFTPSEASQQFITTEFNIPTEKIHVTPLAPSPEFEPVDEDSVLEQYGIDSPYVFHISNYTLRKNPRGVVRSYEIVLNEYGIDMDLIIAGGGWTDADLEEYLQHEETANHIHRIGFIPREDLPALYSHASLLLFPSFTEGFGLPLAESIACGTPVVTTDADAMPEVAGDAAKYVHDPTDTEAIARRIDDLLRNREAMNDAALARAEDFSWDETAKKTINVYRDLVSES